MITSNGQVPVAWTTSQRAVTADPEHVAEPIALHGAAWWHWRNGDPVGLSDWCWACITPTAGPPPISRALASAECRLTTTPMSPSLSPMGCGRRGRSFDQSFWLTPLPPAGPLVVVCAWSTFEVAGQSTAGQMLCVPRPATPSSSVTQLFHRKGSTP